MKDTTIDEKKLDTEVEAQSSVTVNASGHVQQLDRIFGFFSSCSVSIVVDNAWVAGGGSLVVALSNGGAPGVIYEFIAACIFYIFITASLAELASAIPSSASVYHWASVTAGPKYGRVCSWYAGWWNAVAWLSAAMGAGFIACNSVLAMYALYHPDYAAQRWHAYIVFLILSWICASVVLFGQRLLPAVSKLALYVLIIGGLVTTLVVAIMPSKTGKGHASSSFVWREWDNETGYSSNGFVFLTGMLNGAWTIGTSDAVCHVAEEMPQPKRNLPKAMAMQLITGFVTAFLFYVALCYAITSLPDVLNTNITAFPLGAIYLQATGSKGAALALLIIIFLAQSLAVILVYVTTGRMIWTLARDNATPFSESLARISPTYRNPFNATLASAIVTTLISLVYIGSSTAFNALLGCFVIFTTLSYLAAILPHLLTGRKYVKAGPFWMPGIWAYIVMGIACTYIIVFNVIFFFPFFLPVTALNMNYSCVIVGGLTILITLWWFWKEKRGYLGPKVLLDNDDDAIRGKVMVVDVPK